MVQMKQMVFKLLRCKFSLIYPSIKVILVIFKLIPNLVLIAIFITPLVVDLYTNHLLISINESITSILSPSTGSDMGQSLSERWTRGGQFIFVLCAQKVKAKDVFVVETVKKVPVPYPCKPKPKYKKKKKKQYLPKTIVVTIPEKKKEEECCSDDYDYGYDYYQFGGPFGGGFGGFGGFGGGFGGFGPGFGGPGIGFGGGFGPGVPGVPFGPGAIGPGFGGGAVPIG